MNYSFKFMETQADKDFMKKAMNQRLAHARSKIFNKGKVGPTVGRLNASIGKTGSLQPHNAHNTTFTTFNSTSKGRRAFDRSDRSDSRMSNRSASANN